MMSNQRAAAADSKAGKLDFLIAEAKKEHRDNECKPKQACPDQEMENEKTIEHGGRISRLEGIIETIGGSDGEH